MKWPWSNSKRKIYKALWDNPTQCPFCGSTEWATTSMKYIDYFRRESRYTCHDCKREIELVYGIVNAFEWVAGNWTYDMETVAGEPCKVKVQIIELTEALRESVKALKAKGVSERQYSVAQAEIILQRYEEK